MKLAQLAAQDAATDRSEMEAKLMDRAAEAVRAIEVAETNTAAAVEAGGSLRTSTRPTLNLLRLFCGGSSRRSIRPSVYLLLLIRGGLLGTNARPRLTLLLLFCTTA